jgi:hypothetical protein
LLLLLLFDDIATSSTCDAPFRGWSSNAFQGNPDLKSSKKPAVPTTAAALLAGLVEDTVPDRGDDGDSGGLAAGRRTRNDRKMDASSVVP